MAGCRQSDNVNNKFKNKPLQSKAGFVRIEVMDLRLAAAGKPIV
jgi:hypothetical protein